jgi:hypothetical protein
VSDPEKGGQVTLLRMDRAEKIIATKCPNLRLIYTTNVDLGDVVIDKFPHAKIICDKRNNSCSCEKGLQLAATEAIKALKIEELPAEFEELPDFDPEVERISEPVRAQTPAEPSAKDLEELARQGRMAKRDAVDEWKKLKGRLMDLAVQWLDNDEPGAFYAVVRHSTWLGDQDTLERIYDYAAQEIVRVVLSDPVYNSPDEMYERVNQRLRSLRLPEVTHGKMLIEVFDKAEV